MLLYREAPLTQQKLDNKTSDDTTSVDERLNERVRQLKEIHQKIHLPLIKPRH